MNVRQPELWIGTGLAVVLFGCQPVLAEDWTLYRDPQLRFQIELPTSTFRENSTSVSHLELTEIGGNAIVRVYGGDNVKHLTPSQFADEISTAGIINDVTYQAGGPNWIVVSGHYTTTGNEQAPIYYAKYLFSGDLARVAGFEISYSPAEKARMDPVVEGLERSLQLP